MLFVFDLDGVVNRGETPIPGAAAALRRLQEAGHSLFFLTNNSTRSRAHYAEKLCSFGIPALPEQVMTSGYATGLHMRKLVGSDAGGDARAPRGSDAGPAIPGRGSDAGGDARAPRQGPRVFVIGERGLVEEMELAGFQVTLDTGQVADFVVVGLDRELTYEKLARAHWHITRGARFIATNRDGTYPLESGEIPGGGSMVAALEASAGPAELTIGKPEPYTWLHILELGQAEPAHAVMVGDRPETDVLGARRVGMRTVLVLTGVTQEEDLTGLPAEQVPDHVLHSLDELPPLFA